MFKNYIKTTLRHLLKSKINFLFKLSGLVVALLSFLVIVIYVSFQLSYDKYHDNYKSIYRVNSNRDDDGQINQYAMVPPAIGPALKAEFPDVKSFTRISEATRSVIEYNDKLVRSQGFVEADSTIFSVLTFEFIEGDRHALARPSTIVLTESLAKQMFGNDNPIGKLVSFPDQNNRTREVTAVVKDLPRNTHLAMNAIMAIESSPFDPSWEITWDGSVYLFVRLDERINATHFSDKINPMIKKNIPKSDNGQEQRFNVFLQPISDIYLDPSMKMEFFRKGNMLYVHLFSLLGFFILAIAGVNYITLSIADFHYRSKEIAVRKILGAHKKQIAFQFALEAVLLCFSALFLSLSLLYFIFPHVLPFFDSNLKFSMLLDAEIIALVVATIFSLAIFSAVHSIFQLSRNSTITEYKKGTGFGENMSVGKSLLLFQFIVSIICISATLVVDNQVDYIRSKDLGYDRHNLITLIMPEEYPLEKGPVLKNELNKLRSVVSTSFAHYHITGVPYFMGEYEVEENGAMKPIAIGEVFVDHDYLQTMKINLLMGRNFDINNPADYHNAFIVNETAAKKFGWGNPIGKKIRVKPSEGDTEKWEGTVIGVTQDFNTRPLHERVQPVVMRLPFDAWPGYCLNIKIGGPMSETVALIRSTYENVMPGFLIDIRIVEDMFDAQYADEDKALKALQIGTWIIMLISSFGIFSLSMFMSIKRMKEFGIRMVLGATAAQITLIHVGSFIKIVFVANVIALPIAYFLMKAWLDGFSYRIELTSMIFLSVTVISLLIVIFSATYSALLAGKTNPVDVIKIQ